MAVIFAAQAYAAGDGGIQVNRGEPSIAQPVLILLSAAGQSEDIPQSEESISTHEYPGKSAARKQTGNKSGKAKKPSLHSVRRNENKSGASPLSLSSPALHIDAMTSGVAGNRKIEPSDRLGLKLSTTLSAPVNLSSKPNIPAKDEQVTNNKRLSELYAQIAETERRIKEQQSQLDMLDKKSKLGIPGNSVSSGYNVIAPGVAADIAPANTGDKIIRSQFTAPVAQPSIKVRNPRLELLEIGWIQLSIFMATLLLTVPVLQWYRKRKTARQGMRDKLQVTADEQAGEGFERHILAADTTAPVSEQSIKSPAYTEQKLQSILPPEYEMLEEADIYLRFGHDKLAEEALREAIRINPENPQAYLTLSRIYFSREDSAAFLALAQQLKVLGDKNVWSKVAEMGRNLDPGNTFYG